MAVTRMSEKGYVLVPRQLRNKLGFKKGGKVQLTEDKGRLSARTDINPCIPLKCGDAAAP